MSNLFWLTDAQMARLQPFFPKSHGKPRVDDRRVLSGIIFINRNGLRWCDAPKEYGPPKTLYNRWKRWGERGVFARMMEGLPNSPQWAIASTKRTRSAARPLLPPRKRAIVTRRLWFQLDEPRGSEHDARRGMVFQKGALFEWMSVRRNVDFGPRMKGKPKRERDQITDHLLDVVGLQDFKEKAVYELSGGMQQRVALARCLANDPDVILMDEPLGALDALTRERMQSLVLKLWKETGKTIILITHSVEEALLLGERLLVMAPRPGRIHKEYKLPFAARGVDADLSDIKKTLYFGEVREEILSMIWDMEEEIMGRSAGAI